MENHLCEDIPSARQQQLKEKNEGMAMDIGMHMFDDREVLRVWLQFHVSNIELFIPSTCIIRRSSEESSQNMLNIKALRRKRSTSKVHDFLSTLMFFSNMIKDRTTNTQNRQHR